MAYLPGPDGYVKKRILLRKGFMEDHFDELSAIVRGENHRDIMAYVRGWASKREAQNPGDPNPGSPETPEPEPEWDPPVKRKGRPPTPLDREAFLALWASNAPMWAIAKAFGVAMNTLYVRAKAWGLSKRGHVAPRRGSVKMGREHGGH